MAFFDRPAAAQHASCGTAPHALLGGVANAGRVRTRDSHARDRTATLSSPPVSPPMERVVAASRRRRRRRRRRPQRIVERRAHRRVQVRRRRAPARRRRPPAVIHLAAITPVTPSRRPRGAHRGSAAGRGGDRRRLLAIIRAPRELAQIPAAAAAGMRRHRRRACGGAPRAPAAAAARAARPAPGRTRRHRRRELRVGADAPSSGGAAPRSRHRQSRTDRLGSCHRGWAPASAA